MQLPNPGMVNYWRLAENRIFYVDYEIDESIMELQRAILAINIADADKPFSDRKKIVVMINSPGGLLTETMSVAMSMVTSVTPVVTVNIGAAYSGGALLLLAGHERYAFKYAKTMIHTGYTGGNAGTYEQTEAYQKMYKKMVDWMGEYILDRSTIDQRTFNKNKSKDWYMDNDDCIKYGIIHSEITSLDDIVKYVK